MKRTLLLISAALLGNIATIASAASVNVSARAYQSYCSYYSNVTADAYVTLRDDTLPWGTRVTLVHGMSGVQTLIVGGIGNTQQKLVQWQRQEEVEMTSSAPFEWTASLTRYLHSRGSDTRYDGLDFVFRVRLPDGRTYYEKGTPTYLGFYHSPISSSNHCLGGDASPMPRFTPAGVYVVEKN